MVTRVRFNRGATGGRGQQINEAIADIQKVFIGVDENLRRCLTEVGEDILGEAKERAPKDTHALEESGRVRVIDKDTRYNLEISFGGPDNPVKPTSNAPMGWVDYAHYVHEDLEMPHPNGGEAKFLENAFNNQVAKAIERIKACVNEAITTKVR